MSTLRTHAYAPKARPSRWLACLLFVVSALCAGQVSAQTVDLSITKSDGTAVYSPGSTVVYQIEVANAGPDGVLAASVNDPLPPGTTLGAWTCTVTAGTAACGQPSGLGALFTTVDLDAGSQVTFAFTVSVPADYTGALVNTATVVPPDGVTDSSPGNDIASDIDQPQPTVQLAKLSQGGTGTFDYTMANLSAGADSITTTAAGTTATSPVVSPVIDVATAVTMTEAADAAFVLDSAICVDNNAGSTGNPPSFGSLGGNVLTIAPANLLPGAQIVCTFTNQLSVDLAVTKSATPTSARTGEVVAYTITLANNGPGDASDVVLTDAPGAGLDCTAPGPTATCSASGGASCPGATVPVADLLAGGVSIPGVPMGGQVQVVLQCQVTASGQ